MTVELYRRLVSARERAEAAARVTRTTEAMSSGGGAWLSGLLIAAAAAIVCAGLILLLRPSLQRYALARPNARSSHREPTPQGGGIAVIAATMVVVTAAVGFRTPEFAALSPVLAATFLIAVLGAVDDIRPLDVGPRLALQAVAVCAVIVALPAELRVVPMLPWWLERAPARAGRPVVRQSRQLHGRHRLDDGRAKPCR